MNDPSLGGSAGQLSGRDEAGLPILSTLAKRSYRLERGRCVPTERQEPLQLEPIADPEDPELLLVDADVFPYKLRTDVVLHGRAYNHPRRPRFEVALRVGASFKLLRVQGDREVALDRLGRPVFSDPAQLDSLPLSFAFAYGGADKLAEQAYGNPAELLAPYLGSAWSAEQVAQASPFRYPRNPCGRGYLVEAVPEAIDALRLPNIEDPRDLLEPERLVLKDPDHWLAQPVPGGYGWLDYGWFPRVARFGLVPEHDGALAAGALPEVRLGHTTDDLLRDGEPSVHCANGASWGLCLPHLRGDEEIELINVHPRFSTLRFRLPGERPRLFVDGREGKLLETEPVLHTLELDLERERVSLVWRGSARARRPYTGDELTTMPFAAKWS
jgi:hypothetical protein